MTKTEIGIVLGHLMAAEMALSGPVLDVCISEEAEIKARIESALDQISEVAKILIPRAKG
jgi:hypothetical protein